MSIQCATQEELLDKILGLLPHGKLWRTDDLSIETTVMRSHFNAFAAVAAEAELAMCAAYDEFFCSTATINLDLWKEEYGLPDECDPWGDDVCSKVEAIGGTSIAYYEALALALGFNTQMRWLKGNDVEFPGVRSTLHIEVDVIGSAAVGVEILLDDSLLLGWQLSNDALGEADPARLICSLDRILPAHAAITYTLTGGIVGDMLGFGSTINSGLLALFEDI